nr:hypothetical protein [Brucella anthropi]
MYKHEIYDIKHEDEIDPETGYQEISFRVAGRNQYYEYLIEGELCRTGMSQIDGIFWDDEAAEIREQLGDWLEDNPAPEFEELSPTF